MAAIVKTQVHRHRPSWLERLKCQLLLVPEATLLPALFGAYLLSGQATWLAFLGELIICAFILRTALLWFGWRDWRHGRYRRAARLARYAAWLHPWSADTAALRGMIALAQGKHEQAVAFWQRAVDLFPAHVSAQIGLGSALAASGHWNEARWVALQALAHNERLSEAYPLLAETTMHLHEPAQAVLDLTAVGLNTSSEPSIQARLYLTRAEAALSLRQQHLARAAVDQALALLFQCPRAVQAECIYRLGLLRRRLGDYATALHDFERVALVDPEGRWLAPAWRAQHELSFKK